MNVTIEVSMYPLQDGYLDVIQNFIDRVKANEKLEVIVNTLSTQIFGPYDEVMETVQREIKKSYEKESQAIFVMKVLRGNLSPNNG
ncbi:MAG: hypothetical protein CL843_01680 [Crocinitomicaceae bacterium]|nr:hypothetical protein [Crocinitomicaceae bacterium]|tara:strand:+ start:5607 stop:5864 length:258 start_codon:yes stop_codon:yes gene_type:complete